MLTLPTLIFPVLGNTMLPTSILPLALTVVAVDVVAVITLPVILPVPDTIPEPNKTLPPVILPLADIIPLLEILLAKIFPETSSATVGFNFLIPTRVLVIST